MNNNKSKTNFVWLLKMAWRDGKASFTRLFLFVASIILGIGAVVSIQLFSENLRDNIKKQSKSLMGADFIIDTNNEPSEKVLAIIDSLHADASEINFVSMAAFPRTGNTKLVKVRAIEGNFPFYGEIETNPIDAGKTYQNREGAIVDATLLLQFSIKIGDSIKIGQKKYPILGELKSISGTTAISSSIAPTVILPAKALDKTNLLSQGSRKEYQYFFKAPNANLELLEDKIDPILDSENADLDTHTSTSSRLGRRYDNVGRFLNLVAFIALLLGCIGIASSVHIYIKEKLKSVAILKCLGVSRRQSFLIYLFQITAIGFVGGLIGALLGVLLQFAFPYILGDFLPISLDIQITFQPLVIGITLGVVMSILFALLPLLGTWYVSPLAVLREDEEQLEQPKKARIFILGLIILSIYLFAFWMLKEGLYAFYFTLGILFTLSLLALVSVLAMKVVKKFYPKNWNFTKRQSLLNLYRPNNQTLVLILSIGIGSFLISTLYFTKDILLAKTSSADLERDANIILLDVQKDDVKQVANYFTSNDIKLIDNVPIITMRIHSIKDKSAKEIRLDSNRTIRRWIVNREFRVTYRDSLTKTEELISGEWKGYHKSGTPIEISISESLSRDANLEIGDPISFNVQGLILNTKVGSIRKVDWGSLGINFLVLFPNGVLENAPQFNVMSTYAATKEVSANLQRGIVQNFPSITILDLRQVFTIVEDILDKITWVINFMAFFSIFTGLIVLIGSVRNSKYQRIKESVLLRTIGASGKQIVNIAALEYLFLGLIGSLTGILLSLVSSQLLALFIFQEPFVPSTIPFLVMLPVIVLFVMIIGLYNIKIVIKSSPLQVLRSGT